MSYDADYESVYIVEFESGRTIHVQFFDVEEASRTALLFLQPVLNSFFQGLEPLFVGYDW